MREVFSERAQWLSRHILPHEPKLRAWLRKYHVVNLDVDDIVQETYAILASRDSVAEILHPQSYLFRVAYSVILTHVRRSRLVQIETLAALDQLEVMLDQPSPEQEVIDRNELQQLAEMIATMPARTREAFTLRRVDGLSQREVAQRMGLSENTVEKHISKGIRLLMDHVRHGGRSRSQASKGSEEKVGYFGARTRVGPND